MRRVDTPTSDPEAAISAAYAAVTVGYRQALAVPGLPPEESDSLRDCLRAAQQIAAQPLLYPVR